MVSLVDEGKSLEDVYAAKPTADFDEKMGDNTGFINRAYMSLTHKRTHELKKGQEIWPLANSRLNSIQDCNGGCTGEIVTKPGALCLEFDRLAMQIKRCLIHILLHDHVGSCVFP